MTLIEVAIDYRDELIDGIAWLVLYRKGRTWCAFSLYVDYNETEKWWIIESTDDEDLIKEALEIDKNAMIVNGYENCIDMANGKDRAAKLRYLYDDCGCLLKDVVAVDYFLE